MAYHVSAMPKSVPVFYFINPTTPAQGAWCLAVSLIARADFSRPTTCEVKLDEVLDFSQAGLHPRFITELVRDAAKFSFTTYYASPNTDDAYEYFRDEDAFKSIRLFSAVHFSGGYPGSVKVAFHSSALSFLRRLQTGVHQLLRQDDLRPSSLVEHMRLSNSSTILEMAALPNSYMMESLFCVKGTPEKFGHQYEGDL
jgi:hypothetical protein